MFLPLPLDHICPLILVLLLQLPDLWAKDQQEDACTDRKNDVRLDQIRNILVVSRNEHNTNPHKEGKEDECQRRKDTPVHLQLCRQILVTIGLDQSVLQ